MRVLFVCTANRRRSNTAEDYFSAQYPEIEFRSAGSNVPMCRKEGTEPITRELVSWADLILVMERDHLGAVKKLNPLKTPKRMAVLDIPDRYSYYQKDLIQLLEKQASPYLQDLQ